MNRWRARLARMLAEHGECEWVGEAGNGTEAIRDNERFEPDIILMDIRMPGMDGIEAARHIMRVERPPAIIFCTAYEEYAIAAFESRAAGYLLKPLQRQKLFDALRAARAMTRLQLQALARDVREERRFLSARSHAGTRLVPIADVRLLQAEQKYVTAWFPGGSLLLDESLRDIEEEFPGRFLRVHRNALVALEHVSGLRRHVSGESVVMLRGIDLVAAVSRRHLHEVREALEKI